MSYLNETELMGMAGQEQTRSLLSIENPKDPRMFLEGEGWWLLMAIVQVFNTIFFLMGYFCFHISIIDISWGLMPIVPLTVLLVERIVLFGGASVTTVQIVVYALVSIWGYRLAQHILRRYHGADERYIELEKFEAGCPGPLKPISLWFKIFVFQAALAMIQTNPSIYIFYYSKETDSFGVLEIIGLVVWIIGFTFEVVGDWQLSQFVNNPNKVPGKVIDTGLWRITRHPNYFGEVLLWYGIYIMACGGSTGPAGGYYTFYAPLIMHLMIRFFSGVLILEAKQKRKPAFRIYMLETNAFIPWCYKKIDESKREELLAKFKLEIEEDAKNQKGSILFGLVKKEWKPYLLFRGGPKDEEEEKPNSVFTSSQADPIVEGKQESQLVANTLKVNEQDNTKDQVV